MLLDDGLCFHDDGHARCSRCYSTAGCFRRASHGLDDYDAYPPFGRWTSAFELRPILATATRSSSTAPTTAATPHALSLGAADEACIKDRHDAPGWSAMTATVAAFSRQGLTQSSTLSRATVSSLRYQRQRGMHSNATRRRANPARRPANHEGYTSVHSAIFGELECIRMIIDHNPDVSMSCQPRRTPRRLHWLVNQTSTPRVSTSTNQTTSRRVRRATPRLARGCAHQGRHGTHRAHHVANESD